MVMITWSYIMIYFDWMCFVSVLNTINPEPKNFYHSDTGTLFLFNNHVKVQNRDSLIVIYQYTFHILFTLLLTVDLNLTKIFSYS